MKILHLPTSVGGNAYGLSRGERQLGLQSDTLVTYSTWFDYPADINLQLEKIKSSAGKFLKLFATFLDIRNKYDVFHFNFGSSLIHSYKAQYCQLELPFYPKNSKLFATYNGSDARQKSPTINNSDIPSHCYDDYFEYIDSEKLDKMRQKSINKMARYVKHIWALNPDLLNVLPSKKSSFLPYTVSLSNNETFPPIFKKKLKILHAPTSRAAKGSDVILSVFDELKTKYKNSIEFILLENVAHKKAYELYKTADLIVDQILIGWYGAVAVELMQMGKPVVARIAEKDLHFIPKPMADDLNETIINAGPTTIYNCLAKIIENPGILKKFSEASIAYAKKWHNPDYVAGITKQQYEVC